ncbi:hypothetical protein BJ508DRAFT_313501 [Ascobolus immersus RN42]|uniref:Uncharacterized protein n=1 Tax=Ascobolus immersus RN42 TaxID=1160509 RepID=A0A3N4HIN7_ASCIM|nr:hypothetical protein BJ508DRAFT_313501 [Ascobolus immersus RN42]
MSSSSTINTSNWPAWAVETPLISFEISSKGKGFPKKVYATAATVYTFLYEDSAGPHSTDLVTIPGTLVATLPTNKRATITGNYIDTALCPTETVTVTETITRDRTCPTRVTKLSKSCDSGKMTGLIVSTSLLAVLVAILGVALALLVSRGRLGQRGRRTSKTRKGVVELPSDYVGAARPEGTAFGSPKAELSG